MDDDRTSVERESRLRMAGAVALMAVGVGGLLWVMSGGLSGSSGKVKAGAPVGSVQVVDARGATHRLSEYRGQVLVVDVWATWCPPCRASLPEVAALQKAADGRYRVLAISVDREGWGAVTPFLNEKGLGLEAVLPASSSALAPFGAIPGIPTTILIDREGRIVTRWSGFYPGRAETELKKLLGG